MSFEYKVIKELKTGYMSIKIELVEYTCKETNSIKKCVLKHFRTKKKFLHEIEGYKILESEECVPNVIHKDYENNILGVEYCGETIFDLFTLKERYELKPRIRKLVADIESKYGIYHNDMAWRNMCMKDDKIYIIDWEKWGYINKERDQHNILFDTKTELKKKNG
jgi:tRNA A-37 threonylcarbamoyl transferase component Bud32